MAAFMGIRPFVDTIVASHQQQKRLPFDCGPCKSTCSQAVGALFSLLVLVVALTLSSDAQTAGTDASVVAGLASTANLVHWTGSLPEAAGRTVDVSFALYQESAGGLALWSETQLVKVGSDGRYTVLLGASSAEGLPRALFQSGEARWIEVRLIIAQQIVSSGGNSIASVERDAISDESNETPHSRSLLTAVPYAFKSMDADTLAGRAADDYVTREDLQSAVANQVQAISGMQTSLPVVGTSSQVVGTPLPIGGTSTSPFSMLTGEGTSGYLPTWIGSAILGNSIIAESGTNVGIGTNTPATTLDVNGDSTLRGVVSLPAMAATLATGVNSPALQLGASTYSSTSYAAVPQNFAWQAQSAGNNTSSPSANLVLLFGSGTAEPTATGLSISPNGQITFTPGQTFPGVGAGTITGITTGPGLTGGGSSGNVTLALSGPVSTANGGTGAADPTGALANLGGAALSGATFTGAITAPSLNNTSLFTVTGLNPNSEIDNNLSIGNDALSASVVPFGNTAIGAYALQYATGGNDLTAVGNEAMLSTVTSDASTAIGSQSQKYMTSTSGYNTSVGVESLRGAFPGTDIGSYNSAYGSVSMGKITTGNYNSALGYYSLFNNTTGSYNTCIGANCGEYISGGSTANTAPNYAVFIGYNTEASAATDTNEIVIGANAVGNGSNTLTLGNSSITGLYVPGIKATYTTSCLEISTTGYITNTGVACGSGSISGLTAGQLGIAGSSSTLTSSIAYATANTASTLVERDSSSNINATTFTGALNGNASTSTNISTNGTSLQVWGMNSGATAQGWQAPYSLPTASSSTLGGVKPDGISITNSSGAISVANWVADVTFTTGTTAVTGHSCNPTAGVGGTSVTMTGLTSTMTLMITPSTDVSSVTGWGAPTSTVLYIVVKPGNGAFTYYVCNNSATSVTPGSSITWNVSAR
jgi:hypothetical protein